MLLDFHRNLQIDPDLKIDYSPQEQDTRTQNVQGLGTHQRSCVYSLLSFRQNSLM